MTVWSLEYGVRMTIRNLNYEELKGALPLIYNVFCEYEAPNYSEEAKHMFKNAIFDEDYLATLIAYGAYDNDTLVGVLATKNNDSHVALFFVDGAYHRRGIGKALWDRMMSENSNNRITVHSSIYAVPIYEKLGFIKTEEVRTEDGITFVPMVFMR
jgi:Acetyltransferases